MRRLWRRFIHLLFNKDTHKMVKQLILSKFRVVKTYTIYCIFPFFVFLRKLSFIKIFIKNTAGLSGWPCRYTGFYGAGAPLTFFCWVSFSTFLSSSFHYLNELNENRVAHHCTWILVKGWFDWMKLFLLLNKHSFICINFFFFRNLEFLEISRYCPLVQNNLVCIRCNR